MMYASLSAYLSDKRNRVTLYAEPPGGGPSSLQVPSRSANERRGSLHRRVTLEDEMRELQESSDRDSSMSDKVEPLRGVITLPPSDSILVKLLNYLKEKRVSLVKIEREMPSVSLTGSVSEHGEDDIAVGSPPGVPVAVSTFRQSSLLSSSPTTTTSPISIHYDIVVNMTPEGDRGKRMAELLEEIEQHIEGTKGHVEERRAAPSNQLSPLSAIVPSKLGESSTSSGGSGTSPVEVSPGFPMHIAELDISARRVLMYGTDLDADHPGFKDPDYRQRRMMFGRIAMSYRHGQPLPHVEYSDSERSTWRTVFCELMRLYPTHACSDFLVNLEQLQRDCNYNEHDVPQLDDVSRFLKSKTGFQLRPVAGYLSPRDFLAGLAFRVFHTTQYVRHPSVPFYSPEPDCCHELLGHVPMLANSEFAAFSQEIGLVSLGASEDDIKKLATLYFFTIEFGLAREVPQNPTDVATYRAYGAGLLSCVAELKHVLAENPDIRKFEPVEAIHTECMITTFQETYFYTESFEEAVADVRRFAAEIKKPFVVRYNGFTESLEIIDNPQGVDRLFGDLKQDVTILRDALRRLGCNTAIKHYASSAVDGAPDETLACNQSSQVIVDEINGN